MAKVNLKAADFAGAFGVSAEDLDPRVISQINQENFGLVEFDKDKRDAILLECLERIASDKQIVGDISRTDVWEKGWQENLQSFLTDSSSDSLLPKFMRPNLPVRWQGEFYQPEIPNFEVAFSHVLRTYLFSLFEQLEIEEFHEFGAGTGWNLLHAAEFFGNRVQLVGSDFVQSAVDLMTEVARVNRLRLTSRIFDMREPDQGYSFNDASRAAVFTFGAMEQLAGDIKPFVDFLIEQKPAIVVNIEPAIETYDKSSLVDYLAHRFQSRRGYSAGLVELLRQHDLSGDISVERIKRIGFGSMMMEGYNLFIWRPLP